MKFTAIDFASHSTYHDIPLHDIDLSEAEGCLSDERKKHLRTAAKEKTGQTAGAGALSSVARGVYNKMVKQAVSERHSEGAPQQTSHLTALSSPQAVKRLWKDAHEENADADDGPLTDVEYEDVSTAAAVAQQCIFSVPHSTRPTALVFSAPHSTCLKRGPQHLS